MATCTSFFTDLADALSRFDLVKFAAILAPFLTAAIAYVALRANSEQAKRTEALNKRQADIAEAKVRSDLFDRRYAAWLDLRQSAKDRYLGIHGMKPLEPVETTYPREVQGAFLEAEDRLFFLFGNDVASAVTNLDKKLVQFAVAKKKELNAQGHQAQVLLGGKTLEANMAADDAMNQLKHVMKRYMEPSAAS
jgi:hypothetical protein